MGLLLMTFGCQKDDDLKSSEQDNILTYPKYSVNQIDANDVLENKALSAKINKIKDLLDNGKSQEGTLGKTMYVSEYDFFIDTDQGIEIMSQDSYNHTFTFPIMRVFATDTVENLLLSLQEDGTFKAMLVAYNIDNQEIENINNEVNVDLTNKVNVYNLDDDAFVDGIFNRVLGTGDCVGRLTCPFGPEDHEAGQKCVDADRGDLYLDTSVCASGSQGGGTTGIPPGGNTPNNNGPQTSQGGGGTSSSPPGTLPVIPVKQPWQKILDCVPNLFNMPNSLGWLQDHKGAAGKMSDYLEENECSEEASVFAQLAVKAWLEDGEVDFPNKIIYDLSFANYQCQREIISDASSSCSPIGQVLLNIFESSDDVNLLFTTSNLLPTNTNANTSSQSACNNGICEITITFNQALLQTASDLAIARTAIHESLHAILVRMYENGSLTSSDGQPLEGYENLVGAYLDHLSGLQVNINKPHHELMTEFVEDMATALSFYDNSEQSFSFYKKLCWSGLTTTDIFLSLYPKYLNAEDEFNNLENYNPEWLNIKLILQAERDNETVIFNHPNGNVYEFNPKGYAPNPSAPCN